MYYTTTSGIRIPTAFISDLPLAAIDTGPFVWTFRVARPPDAVDRLVENIRAEGFRRPLLVRENRGRYELVTGTLRLVAAEALGRTTVPAVLIRVDEMEAVRRVLWERYEDRRALAWSPLETAWAAGRLQRMLEQRGSRCDARAVGSYLSKSAATTGNLLRVAEAFPQAELLARLAQWWKAGLLVSEADIYSLPAMGLYSWSRIADADQRDRLLRAEVEKLVRQKLTRWVGDALRKEQQT